MYTFKMERFAKRIMLSAGVSLEIFQGRREGVEGGRN